MAVPRIVKTAAALASLCVLAVVGYEAVIVWRAGQKTLAIVSHALAAPMEVAPSDLPDARRAMLLAVEDPGFLWHGGIDFSSPGQGRTTITQELAELYYFDPLRPGFPRLELALIAYLVLDPFATKQQQLALFLNRANFGEVDGRRISGFAAAARTYLNKEFRALDDGEFLSLVAMLIAPDALDPLRHAEANRERVGRIRNLLEAKCQPTGVRDAWYEACPSN